MRKDEKYEKSFKHIQSVIRDGMITYIYRDARKQTEYKIDPNELNNYLHQLVHFKVIQHKDGTNDICLEFTGMDEETTRTILNLLRIKLMEVNAMN